MDENESGQLGNREIITVCIAVSLAVILVASLMPAMIPSGGGEEPMPPGDPVYYIELSELKEDEGYYHMLKYYEWDGTSTLIGYINPLYGFYAGGWLEVVDGYVMIGTNQYDLDYESDSFKGTSSGIMHLHSGGSWEPLGSTQITTYLNAASIEYTLTEEQIREMLMCTNIGTPDDPFVPPTPPSPTMDTNTVIVMAIIAIIFLGIALTALRTVLPGRGGQRCPQEPASVLSTRLCAKQTTGSVRGSPEGSTTPPVRSVAPNPRHQRPR